MIGIIDNGRGVLCRVNLLHKRDMAEVRFYAGEGDKDGVRVAQARLWRHPVVGFCYDVVDGHRMFNRARSGLMSVEDALADLQSWALEQADEHADLDKWFRGRLEVIA